MEVIKLFYALTVWAIIDIARKDFGSIGKKAIWAFIALIPFIGWLIYLIFGFRKGSRSCRMSPSCDNHS
jgi:uncharacterized membrane protein YhaH (DUF805 family)